MAVFNPTDVSPEAEDHEDYLRYLAEIGYGGRSEFPAREVESYDARPTTLSGRKQAERTASWQWCVGCNDWKAPRWFATPLAPDCLSCSAEIAKGRQELRDTPFQRGRREIEKRCRRHGITAASYDKMLAAQDGRCAICEKKPRADRPLHIDHDHETGRVRGLLCSTCNTGIGFFADSRSRMDRAIAYIETTPASICGVKGFSSVANSAMPWIGARRRYDAYRSEK